MHDLYTLCKEVNMKKKSFLIALFLFSIFSVVFFPQVDDKKIDSKQQYLIIKKICTYLEDIYIFPEKAVEMKSYLTKQYRKGKYKSLTSAFEFAQQLRSDLRFISNDAHLGVDFENDDYFGQSNQNISPEEQQRERFREEAYENFGFLKLERLAGNVGYIQMNGFYDSRWAGKTVAAAMSFLSHCDAIIIDLRLTLGGQPSMVQLLASYFFEEPVHLNDFYIRKTNSTKQFWSYAYVPGEKFIKGDLFILTSKQTPSAAEEFAYDMKHLNRAILVGECTRGAAHPTEIYDLPEHNIVLSIPYGRAINPVTKTNWEGTGVKPHLEVPAENALNVAHKKALEAIRSRTSNDDHARKLDWAIGWLDAQISPVKTENSLLQEYAGRYGPRTFMLNNSKLEYHSRNGKVYELVCMGGDLFLIKEMYYLRFQFLRNEKGKIAEVVGLTEYGPASKYGKENDRQ